MGNLTSLDVVYIAAIFVVPGYVFSAVRGYFIPARVQTETNYVKLLTLSGVNFALFGWVAYLELPSYLQAAVWAFVLILGPALSAVVSAWWTKRGYFRRAFGKLNVDAMHPIPTSWDYAFTRAGECWVLVVLKDGTKFAGYWGSQSFASSENSERDVYIERVYECPDDGSAWVPTNKSALITGGEIRSIEFFTTEIFNDGKEDNVHAKHREEGISTPEGSGGTSTLERARDAS